MTNKLDFLIHKIMLKSLQDIRIINVVDTHQELCNDERHHPGTYGVFHTSEYILLNKLTGDRMHNDGINNTLRRVNKKLATPQKGNHIIRKTYISSLDAYSDLTDEEIRMVAGHKYISTTQNSYMFSVKRPESRIVEFEKALGKSVTPCYPNSDKKENAGNV